MSGQGGSIFLLGSRPQSVKLAADGIIERYPGIKLAGTADGRFVDDTELLDVINDVSPDLLLVCMSSPKQELWLADACTELNVGLSVGLGTVIEGRRKEGFFRRLFHNPGRTLKIPRMILAALWKRIAG